MKKLDVYTKRMPSGIWSCYTTYQGIDKAFTGETENEVRLKMSMWLSDELLDITWHETVIHASNPPPVNHEWNRPRLDHNPFG